MRPKHRAEHGTPPNGEAGERYLRELRQALAAAPSSVSEAALEDAAEWIAEFAAEEGVAPVPGADAYNRIVRRFGKPADVAARYAEGVTAKPKCRGMSGALAWAATVAAAVAVFTSPMTFSPGRAIGGDNDPPKLSPFTAVTFQNDGGVSVRYDGQDYRWIAIDGVPVDRIVGFTQGRYGEIWQKRVAEDLVEVLQSMGESPEETVSLRLIDADGTVQQIAEAEMTHENRQKIWRPRSTYEPVSSEELPKLSPFTRVQFGDGDEVRVTYEGAEYRWLAIDGVPVAEVVDFAKKRYEDRWQKRVAEDLVEVLTLMEAQPSATVSLRLRDPEGDPVMIEAAKMTHDNRKTIRAADDR